MPRVVQTDVPMGVDAAITIDFPGIQDILPMNCF